MHLIAAGLNHRTAPLEIREKLSLGQEQFQEALKSLAHRVEQGMLLSTCNRTEVYVAGAAPPSPDVVLEYLRSISGLSAEDLLPYLYTLTEAEAVRHLFRVTAGLDSMVIGEFEVLGQVRRAMEQAERLKLLPMPLRRLFQEAVRVGRKVRAETAISQDAASISSVAVSLARKLLGDLRGRRALVVSAGEAGELALEAVLKAGAFQVSVTSRYLDKAERLAGLLGATALPYDRLDQGLAEADLVITSSYAPHFLIRPPMVERAIAGRPGRPILFIDIAVPRVIDPEVTRVAGVHLCDLDDLKEQCEANLARRGGEVEKAAAIIEEEMQRFVQWWDVLEIVPTIAALREGAEAVLRDRLARTMPKLHNLSEEDRARIEAMTRSLVDKLLHVPISYMKANGDSAHRAEVVREVFRSFLSERKADDRERTG